MDHTECCKHWSEHNQSVWNATALCREHRPTWLGVSTPWKVRPLDRSVRRSPKYSRLCWRYKHICCCCYFKHASYMLKKEKEKAPPLPPPKKKEKRRENNKQQQQNNQFQCLNLHILARFAYIYKASQVLSLNQKMYCCCCSLFATLLILRNAILLLFFLLKLFYQTTWFAHWW